MRCGRLSHFPSEEPPVSSSDGPLTRRGCRSQSRRTTNSARQSTDELLGFLTPIVKACLTEKADECTYHALQIFGGHGYIAEHGMEQFARDARITTIYEGTTGIQALDLLGRKIMQLQGVGLRAARRDLRAADRSPGRGRAGGVQLDGRGGVPRDHGVGSARGGAPRATAPS